MNRPEGISPEAWSKGVKEAQAYVDWLRAGNSTGELSEHAIEALADSFARAIQSSVEAERAAERERCAKVADAIAAGRSRQKMEATTAKKRTEARDFESMAMSAIEVSYEIRKGA